MLHLLEHYYLNLFRMWFPVLLYYNCYFFPALLWYAQVSHQGLILKSYVVWSPQIVLSFIEFIQEWVFAGFWCISRGLIGLCQLNLLLPLPLMRLGLTRCKGHQINDKSLLGLLHRGQSIHWTRYCYQLSSCQSYNALIACHLTI